MVLTRKFLSAMGIEADKIDEIINAHSETVDGLKEQLGQYKASAEKLASVQKELDDLKAAAEKDGKDPYKVKYEAIKEEFEKYKTDQADKETKAQKSAAYRALLKEAGVADKRLDAVLKVSDIDGIELDKDGKIKGADKMIDTIKADWSDFIQGSEAKGADVKTPPVNSGKSYKSREEIYKRDDNGRFLLNASERQAALAQINAAEQQKG